MLRLAVFASSLAILVSLGIGPAESGGPKKKTPIDGFMDADGQPKEFRGGQPAQYAIWHHDGRWHLRTTTDKNEHRFKGSIAIEGGKFERAFSHDLEKEGKLADIWIVNPAGTEIVFDFKTDHGIDGINFTVSKGAKAVRFNLLQDGNHRADRIFIGQNGHHPVGDPFRLAAHKAK